MSVSSDKVYSSYSYVSYQNYNTNLYETSYKGIKRKNNYNILNNNGYITGYVVYSHKHIWRIYNDDNKQIGFVQTNWTNNKYTVYDIEGNFVTTTITKKSNIDGGTVLYIVMISLCLIIIL